MRHLINMIGVGPTDLAPYIMSIYPGLAPFAVRCRIFGAHFRRTDVNLHFAK